MTRPAVELHEAFFWACDDCGRDNFARAVEIEPESDLIADEDRVEAAVAMATAGANGGAFLMRPGEVKCSWCGAEFNVE